MEKEVCNLVTLSQTVTYTHTPSYIFAGTGDITYLDPITIPSGASLGNCDAVTVVDDMLLEPDEDITFTISSFSPTGPLITTGSPNTHTVTISDNDGQYNKLSVTNSTRYTVLKPIHIA